MSRNKIIFIADAYYEDFTGGAELNDHSLIIRLLAAGYEIVKKKCHEIDVDFLKDNKEENFIVGNFRFMSDEIKNYLSKNNKYIIYEHDHKYLKKRNPLLYPNFKAPDSDLKDIFFYEGAIKTICLTKLAHDVFVRNTGLINVDRVGASIWLNEDLDFIKKISNNAKNNKYAILQSNNPIKRTIDCIQYCKNKNIEYDLISDRDNKKFLEKLSKYKGLVFKTGHLETCGRLVVEAKMLNCELIIQKKLIGAAHEPWFSLTGNDLNDKIRDISEDSINVFIRAFKNDNIHRHR